MALQDIVIAVMGVTGVGKSYFIEKATGRKVKIGQGLESCTSEIGFYSVPMPPYMVHLVDTPGFDDTNKNDAEILTNIADFLASIDKKRCNLSGILYLHQMTDNKMKGSALKNLQMFQQLIGDRCLKNCVLTTTKWGLVDPSVGETRERELLSKPQFWKYMVSCGARTERFDDTRAGAWRIISTIAGLQGCVPQLTQELRHGAELKDTAAGRIVSVDLEKKLREKHDELQRAQMEADEALQRKDTEMQELMAEEKARVQEEIAEMQRGQELLQQKFEEEREDHNNRQRSIAAAYHQRKENSSKRFGGRLFLGGLGTLAILGSGGLLAPVVAIAAGVNEAVNHDEKKADKARLNAAK